MNGMVGEPQVAEVDETPQGCAYIKKGCMREIALPGTSAFRGRDAQKRNEEMYVSLILLMERLQVPHTV